MVTNARLMRVCIGTIAADHLVRLFGSRSVISACARTVRVRLATAAARLGPGVAGRYPRPVTTAADPPLHQALGLTDAELDDIRSILGREPNHLELAMYAVMWSEHCSYKSSRIHLKRLPTEGEGVLVGPGENAGVMDVGDGIAAAIRIESHNHPSATSSPTRAPPPVSAASCATSSPWVPVRSPSWTRCASDHSTTHGAAGWPKVSCPASRDTATRSACPPSVVRSCSTPATRAIRSSTCSASACCRSTGWCSARPPASATRSSCSARAPVVTASAAPACWRRPGSRKATRTSGPSVQVGDPFEEKRLIEACLALLDADLVVGIQDLGAAGLSGASSETASRGGVGMDFDVQRGAASARTAWSPSR